jgi:HK97 family phage portal protein
VFLSNGAVITRSTQTADLSPMWPGGMYYTPSSLSLLDRFAAYGELYSRQVWVHVVVRKLAYGTARLPFEVRYATDAGIELAPPTDPLARLLDRPNDQLTGLQLWLWTSATKSIYGEAYWWKLRGRNGAVREIQPLHPANVLVERTASGGLTYYWSAGTSNPDGLPPIPARDIVPFCDYNPETLARGLSSLEPLRDTLYNEDASRRATASWWRRGARPSIALTHPGTLSEGAQIRLRKTWDEHHMGADLMGGTAILEEGLKPEVLQLSAEEMQYIESRKLNREEVCAAYDMPPPAVHILDHATYSNITEQMRSVYRDTQAPRLAFFESAVNHYLVPDFDDSGATRCSFNLAEVLRGDYETRATAARDLIQCGVLKPSEARPLFQLNPAGPEADQLYANAALVPLGSTPHDEPPPEPGGAPALAGGTRSRYTVRALAGRLGQGRAKAQGAQRARLVAEHYTAMVDYFTRQGAAVDVALSSKDGKLLDGDQWNADLAALLLSLATVTARLLGGAVADQLDGRSYDAATIANWLRAGANAVAVGINETTANQLADALDGQAETAALARAYFAALDPRADQIAQSRVTVVGSMAEHDAAVHSGAHTKTWVTGRHPRLSHEALDGETVSIDGRFSNGLERPGDPSGNADELANCNCTLSFSTEGTA